MKSLQYYLRKGFEEPSLIIPFLRRELNRILPRIRSKIAMKDVNELQYQKTRLDELRDNEEYLLIVLDACRFDYFTELIGDYFEEDEVCALKSCGRLTFEYVKNAWPEEYEAKYLSAAPPVNSLEEDEFGEEMKRHYSGYVPSEHISEIVDLWSFRWDTQVGTVPPEKVTEAG